MLDGKQLRRLFQQFNEQYFGGKLPAYRIRVVGHISLLGESGRCKRRQRLIEIRRGQPDEKATNILLHEMAHAATSGSHGMPWKKEMVRLREAGAPLCPPDSEVSLDDWSGENVSRRHFRSVVQDALIGYPDITLSQAIKHFSCNEGGPQTIAAFLKKYPWVRSVYKNAKKERADHEKMRAQFLAMLNRPKLT